MATWIIGDIHGCSEELKALLDRLELGATDRVLAVGDLLHRGPDPVGVIELLRGCRAEFVLGNHECIVLERFGIAPRRADASDRPALREELPPPGEIDLGGDGGAPCHVAPEDRADVLDYLQTHGGYFREQTSVPGAGPTPDGRLWCVVHAGVVPGRHPSETEPVDLIRLRRLHGRGRPFWYEVFEGPNLIVFGHMASKIPRMRRHGGKLVALGLDTGCVYGGKLTAYCPETDDLVQVPAARAYWDGKKDTSPRPAG